MFTQISVVTLTLQNTSLINFLQLEGREVVRREDIMPTSMGGWIDISDPQLHECCTYDSYEKKDDEHAGVCTFYPPDACKFELMRCLHLLHDFIFNR